MEEEKLEQTNKTENVETQTTEENVGGIELTDTAEEQETEEIEEVKKSLRDLLKENPEYQSEFNEMLTKRLNRRDREEKRTLAKYKDTENVLRQTLNLNENDDVNTKLREYYESDGVKLPERVIPEYDAEDTKYLAERYADEIIDEGFDSMEAEANRLATKGGNRLENLNERERIIFDKLATTLKYEKNKKGLLSIGADTKLLKDDDFKSFQKQFTYDTPIEKIYELYLKNKKKETAIENPGSMKNCDDSSYKEYYTPEEIAKLTDEQLDDPKIWEAVRRSQTKNYKNHFE